MSEERAVLRVNVLAIISCKVRDEEEVISY